MCGVYMNKINFLSKGQLIALVFGLTIGASLNILLSNKESNHIEAGKPEKKPLYWVAPMDANYRRNEPGKSPMGMDLIPVYEEQGHVIDAGPGTVSISPQVINNIGVRTGTVLRETLHGEIVTVGYVRYDENQLIHIHPRVSGWVETLFVKAAGDPVKKSSPLYSLYSPELVNAQEELLLAVNRNNTRLIKASEDRLRALHISSDFIRRLKRTGKIQQTINFYARQDGVIDNLNIREGYYVQPGTTMLSVGALDNVWVEAEVFERQASLVKANDPVTMTLDYLPGKEWTGKVDYIYPTVDSKTRTVRIRSSFKNADHLLKPNMFAQITIHTDSSEPLLVVPREALIRTGDQDRVVLALGGGAFKSIAVKIGRTDPAVVEILEGLSEGDKIVTSAQFLLDSESNKTSDFKRMHSEDTRPKFVWVSGEIHEIYKDRRTVLAHHEEILVWQRPPMTMEFKVNGQVDFDQLQSGMKLQLKIGRRDDGAVEIAEIATQEINDHKKDVHDIDKHQKSVEE